MPVLTKAPVLTHSFNEEWEEHEVKVTFGKVTFLSSWIELMEEGEEEDLLTGEILLSGLESSSPGSGLGPQVLDLLKKWAKTQGFKAIVLTPGGKHLENFYLKGGFQPPKKGEFHWKCKL